MNKQGFSVVLILLLLSGVGLVCIRSALSSSLFLDAALQKEQGERAYWLVEGLLQYAVTNSRAHYEQMQQSLRELSEIRGRACAWPLPGSPYQGEFLVTAQNNALSIRVVLYYQEQIKGAACCNLSRVLDQDRELFTISHWHHEVL